ncbi:MAG: SAM-dependent methyltransferase, partial [uncultured Sulfurovum sp.]
KIDYPKKKMLVTQKKVGEATKQIETLSKSTWTYLCDHGEKLDSRKSSIYRNSPRFSIFGVGEYTFKPWKVVISGLYKNTRFSKIGCHEGKPIVVDDTCYMLGFDSEKEADFVLSLLLSDVCQDFISSIVFLDNKRPITVALLSRINLRKIAELLGVEKKYEGLFIENEQQMSLL